MMKGYKDIKKIFEKGIVEEENYSNQDNIEFMSKN